MTRNTDSNKPRTAFLSLVVVLLIVAAAGPVILAETSTETMATTPSGQQAEPDGFTGDACFTGGCGRSFAKNG